jgi:hypothetical protein
MESRNNNTGCAVKIKSRARGFLKNAKREKIRLGKNSTRGGKRNIVAVIAIAIAGGDKHPS